MGIGYCAARAAPPSSTGIGHSAHLLRRCIELADRRNDGPRLRIEGGMAPTIESLADQLTGIWRRTDLLFGIVRSEFVLARPIALRNPILFYIGHLPAFCSNHYCRAVMRRPPIDPTFDEIFERGIDPDVDDPSRCHPHPEAPDAWPTLGDVLAYRDKVREQVVATL